MSRAPEIPPARIPHAPLHPGPDLVLASEWVALPSDLPPTPDEHSVQRIGDWRVVPTGSPSAPSPGARPVYRVGTDGPLAVATGRVWVRFAGTPTPLDRRAVLAAAGYSFAYAPPWAPSAAWLVAADGDVAHALAGIERLRGLPEVELAEPELIRASVPR